MSTITVRTVGQPVVLDRVSRAGTFDVDDQHPVVIQLLASGHLEEVASPLDGATDHETPQQGEYSGWVAPTVGLVYPDPLPQGEFLPEPEE